MEDFRENLEYIVPDDFNFAYDVMDEWARVAPDKLALMWTNDQGEEKRFSFSDMKRETDKVASYLLSIGIGKDFSIQNCAALVCICRQKSPILLCLPD